MRICRNARLVAVAAKLAADRIGGDERPHRAKRALLFVPQRIRMRADGRLHREQRHHLEQMILHDVADGADLFVELAASVDAAVLGHRHLHALDVIGISK